MVVGGDIYIYISRNVSPCTVTISAASHSRPRASMVSSLCLPQTQRWEAVPCLGSLAVSLHA